MGPVIAVSLAVVAGCGSSAPDQVGIQRVEGGRQVAVPVPWADIAAGVAGIEESTVWVGDREGTGFEIDLQGLEAQGAGGAWTAASATAAAVAALYSGDDPSHLDVSFTVTGPIDGPSAGALLTVAVLAALREDPLLPGVTMTGTVSPDGSVSAVGGVGLKLQAAAEAGYTTMLVPLGNAVLQVRGTDDTIATVDYGRAIGIDVQPVATIADAYRELTGQPLTAADDRPYVLPETVMAAGAATAVDLIQGTRALVDQLSPGSTAAAVVAEDLAAAQTALDSSEPSVAYGLAAEARFVAGREIASAEYADVVAREGMDAAVARLAEDIAAALGESEEALIDGSSVDGLGLEQTLSLPAALSWSTYALSALLGLQAAAPSIRTAEQLAAAITVLEEQRLSVEVFQPDALEVLRAMPSAPLQGETELASFLSAYTNFLVRAAQANEQYIVDVVLPSVPRASDGIDDVRSLIPILEQLDRQTRAIDLDPGAAPKEIVQSSMAMTHFVVSASFIAGTQSFAGQGFSLVSDAALEVDEAAVQVSFDSGLQTLEHFAADLSARGRDAGYPVWSSEWGAAAFASLSAQGRTGAGAVLGFNELWFDVISLQMMDAGIEALDSGPVDGRG